ncbi:MAG: vWA domain-containing protein [Pseudomonadota bacterium]
MLEFIWPWVFLALPLPLLIYWFVPRAPRQEAALQVPFFRQALQLRSDSSHRLGRKPVLLTLCILIWLLMVTAASRPQWAGEPQQLPATGRDMMLVLDMSGSMEARDMFLDNTQLSRFRVMKEVVSDFAENRQGDRLGIILFSRFAYMLTPMTFDLNSVAGMIQDLEVGVIDESATAIGDGIGLAVKHLREQPENNRVMILLTDGVNNSGELTPDQAGQLAETEGVRVHIVGLASDQFARQSAFIRSQGNSANSEIDDAAMTRVAQMTGGRYFRARTLEDLVEIYDELDQIEPIEQDDQTFRPVKVLFHWPLGIAMLLSFLMALVATPVGTRLLAFRDRGAGSGMRSGMTGRPDS